MATIDDILNGNGTTKKPVQPAKQQAPIVKQPAIQQQPAAPTATQPVAQPTAQPATQQPVAQPTQPAMAQEPATTSVAQPSSVTQPATQQPTTQPEAAKPVAKSEHPLTEIIKALYPQPTPEEEAAEAKRKKREEVFASISDGLSALANLYFTTKDAPNAYNPAYSQSARVKSRWDALEANRAANRKAYIADYIRAQQADAEAADRDRQYELEKAKADADQKLADAKEKRDAAMHDLNVSLKNNLIDKASYDKKMAEEKAKFEGEKQKLDVEAKRAAIALTKARMNHINSSGSGGGSGSGSRSSSGTRSSGGTRAGGSGRNESDANLAYEYWMSLTPSQKNQYRDWNNRATKRTARRVTYKPDDKNFIMLVWDQRKAYLRNHGRGGEIGQKPFSVNDYRRGGGKKKSSKLPPLN